jgi:hypothetical protein
MNFICYLALTVALRPYSCDAAASFFCTDMAASDNRWLTIFDT